MFKEKFKNIFCVNCGEKGHIIKDCSGPITSFGLIAFKNVNCKDDEKDDINSSLQNILKSSNIQFENIYPKIKFLLIQRKDTMGYIDFIRGKYNNRPGYEIQKQNKINTCLQEMTTLEKQNLLTQDFDTIWDELWINKQSRLYKNEYELAKKKFNNLDIKTLLSNIPDNYTYSEFGFPKGRRNMYEAYIDCAIREFREETGYSQECYEFIKDYPIITEQFIGTNNVSYRHIYLLVKMKDNIKPPSIDTDNILQIGEVKNIGWFSFNECIQLIRPYNTVKKHILQNVYTDLLNMNNYNCTNTYNNNTLSKNNERHKLQIFYNDKYSFLIESSF